MARVNARPDIIYVKDLSERDKDNFEAILKKFRTTNNGEAVKMLLQRFLIAEKEGEESAKRISQLERELVDTRKDVNAFINNKESLISSLSSVEATLKKAKAEISKLK